MDTQMKESTAELLENDGSAFGRNLLLKELDAMAFTVKKVFDAGITPDQKESMDNVRTAIESAKELVDLVWTETHNS